MKVRVAVLCCAVLIVGWGRSERVRNFGQRWRGRREGWRKRGREQTRIKYREKDKSQGEERHFTEREVNTEGGKDKQRYYTRALRLYTWKRRERGREIDRKRGRERERGEYTNARFNRTLRPEHGAGRQPYRTLCRRHN